jgi:hypothetical protein
MIFPHIFLSEDMCMKASSEYAKREFFFLYFPYQFESDHKFFSVVIEILKFLEFVEEDFSLSK